MSKPDPDFRHPERSVSLEGVLEAIKAAEQQGHTVDVTEDHIDPIYGCRRFTLTLWDREMPTES